MAEPKNNLITKNIQISASSELWEAFKAWLAKQGCTSTAEGFRTAMRQVTNFDPESQVKTT